MSEQEKIKPCPFCGTPPEYDHSQGAAQIWCPNDDCGLIGFVDSESAFVDNILKKWNQREYSNE